MNNIVIDLQKDCLDDSVKVSTLIKKAYVISKKLNISDFTLWSKNELNGYSKEDSDLDQYPDYRILNVEYKAFNPYHGWIPVMIPSTSSFSVLLTQNASESIEQIENLIIKEDGMLSFSVSPDIQQLLNQSGPVKFEIRGFVGKNQFVGLLNSVRSIVLDWTLKLEENGIIGSGITFTKEEKERASTGIVNYGTIIYGNVNESQVNGSGHKISQNKTFSESESLEITRLIELIESNYKSVGVTDNQIKEIEKSIKQIRKELKMNKGKEGTSEILRSLKTVFENVAGNLIASGIAYEIAKYIS